MHLAFALPLSPSPQNWHSHLESAIEIQALKGVVKFVTVNLTEILLAPAKAALSAIFKASSLTKVLMMFVRTRPESITVLPELAIVTSAGATGSAGASVSPGLTGSAGSAGSVLLRLTFQLIV